MAAEAKRNFARFMHVHVHVNEELSSVSIKLKVQRTFNVQAIQASILPNVLPVPVVVS